MENEKRVNKKGLFFLICLLGFAFFVVKTTQTNDTSVEKQNSQASTLCANTVVEKGYENTPILLNISEDGEITDVTPSAKENSVLGLFSSCSNASTQYTADSACTINDGSVELDSSKWVRDDAPVEIVKITVPIRLLSGIYSVKDSNRKITMENPVYKPAGEQFDSKQILTSTTPGDGHDRIKYRVMETTAQQKSYSTKYDISAGVKTGDGEVSVNRYAGNSCGVRCNNFANSNPEKSNAAGKYMEDIGYRTPGQEDSKETSKTLTIEGECKNLTKADVSDPSLYGCFSIWNAIKGSLGSIFPSTDWTSCEKPDEGCVNAETIVLKMSPMFSSVNSFTSVRNKTAMPPQTASSYETVYVMTPCIINVGYTSVNVKCAWDMSYIFDERKAAEFDDAGGSDTPTQEQYIEFLKKESTGRTDPLYTM